MKRLRYIALAFALLTTSCNKVDKVDEYSAAMTSYSGDWEIVMMDWTPSDGKVVAVDIDNDGYGSNDIVSELRTINNSSNWPKCRLIQNSDGKTGTFIMSIPVLDYYATDPDDASAGYLMGIPYGPAFRLNVSAEQVDGEWTIVSDKFDHFDWPDDDRLGMKNFGGVQISDAYYNSMHLTVDHYLVYDYYTNKLLDGSVKVWLYKD